MKRIVLAALLAASGLAGSPASAQYFGGESDYRPRREYDYQPRREYDYRQRRDYDDDYRRDYDRPRRGYYGRPTVRLSNTCLTARGACPTYRPQPHGTPCACDIPGFGVKRGAVN